jgi:hypothetical protein
MRELLVLQCMYTQTHRENKMVQDGEGCGGESEYLPSLVGSNPSDSCSSYHGYGRTDEDAEGGVEGGDGADEADSLPDLEDAEFPLWPAFYPRYHAYGRCDSAGAADSACQGPGDGG